MESTEMSTKTVIAAALMVLANALGVNLGAPEGQGSGGSGGKRRRRRRRRRHGDRTETLETADVTEEFDVPPAALSDAEIDQELTNLGLAPVEFEVDEVTENEQASPVVFETKTTTAADVFKSLLDGIPAKVEIAPPKAEAMASPRPQQQRLDRRDHQPMGKARPKLIERNLPVERELVTPTLLSLRQQGDFLAVVHRQNSFYDRSYLRQFHDLHLVLCVGYSMKFAAVTINPEQPRTMILASYWTDISPAGGAHMRVPAGTEVKQSWPLGGDSYALELELDGESNLVIVNALPECEDGEAVTLSLGGAAGVTATKSVLADDVMATKLIQPPLIDKKVRTRDDQRVTFEIPLEDYSDLEYVLSRATSVSSHISLTHASITGRIPSRMVYFGDMNDRLELGDVELNFEFE